MSIRCLALLLAVAVTATAQAQTRHKVARAGHTRKISQLHEPVQQVSHTTGCCDAAPACNACGSCSTCCVCRPCFPLLRGVARRIDRAVTNLLTCNPCCGRPVCGPSGCGCEIPFASCGCDTCSSGGPVGCASGCSGCGGHGGMVSPGPPAIHPIQPQMAPTPAPASPLSNPFQDEAMPATPSSYRRPVRTKPCNSCGRSAQRSLTPASSRRVSVQLEDTPREVVRPVGTAVRQASFSEASAKPNSQPASSRRAKYRR